MDEALRESGDPLKVINRLNDVLEAKLSDEFFMTAAFLVLDRYFFSPAFKDPELITAHPDYQALWSDPVLADFRSLRVEYGHPEGLSAIPASAD